MAPHLPLADVTALMPRRGFSVTEHCRTIGILSRRPRPMPRVALGAVRRLPLDRLVSGEREQVARAADLLNRLRQAQM
jgi:alpha-D-ribose 1-methylphosphonate 5-triphosphate synthase subunit PhnL